MIDNPDFVNVFDLAAIADGSYWRDEKTLDPGLQDMGSSDPLTNDAPTPVSPQSPAMGAEAEVGGQVAEPVAEATPEVPAAAPPAAAAPSPEGADALFTNSNEHDSRADSLFT